MAPERWYLVSNEKSRHEKESKMKRLNKNRGPKVEIKFVFIIWRDTLIMLNCLNYYCIYVFLMVFQSNIVPFFQCSNYPPLLHSILIDLITLFLFCFPKIKSVELFIISSILVYIFMTFMSNIECIDLHCILCVIYS